MRNSKVDQKQPLVQEIATLLKEAKGTVIVDYRGLTVEQDTRLRKQLREANVTYKVYKNTMIHLAAQGTEYEVLDPMLEGPTAVAVSSEDATAPARVLYNFAKTAPVLELKGGVVEGAFYDANTIKEIATIPSRDELLGRLFGSLKSPIGNLARVLNQIAEKQPEVAAAPEAVAEATAEAPAETPAEAPAESPIEVAVAPEVVAEATEAVAEAAPEAQA